MIIEISLPVDPNLTVIFDVTVGLGQMLVIGKHHHCYFPSTDSVSDSDRRFGPRSEVLLMILFFLDQRLGLLILKA